MKESKLFKSLAATFVVIVLSGPAVVLADTLSYRDTPSYSMYIVHAKDSVSYADLNLEIEQGVRVLYQRLQHASKEVCGVASLKIPQSILAKSSRRRATRQCYRESLSNAVDKFDNEDLTRIHAG